MRARRRGASSSAASVGAAVLLWAVVALPPFTTSRAAAQQLAPAEVDSAEAYLHSALAGPSERAYLQVLTQARILPDSTDTALVYDIVVRYDPARFHDPHLGLYPLTFEDQFIQWGKRIALFTRSTRWPSGRFHLHDIAHGQHAWIRTSEARLLYPETPRPLPGPVEVDNRSGQRQWLRLMYRTPAATSLHAMTRWLRLMRREPRDLVLLRSAAEVAARDSLASP